MYILGLEESDDEGEEMDFMDRNIEQHKECSKELFDSPMKYQGEKNWCGDNYINADRFFLVAMPVLFLVFNLIYWFSYGSQFILAEREMDNHGGSG